MALIPQPTSSIFQFPPNFPNGQVSDAWVAYFNAIQYGAYPLPAPSTGFAIGWDGAGNLVNVPNTGANQTAAWTAADAVVTAAFQSGDAATLATVRNFLSIANAGSLSSNAAAFTVIKTPTDSSNPNIVALFRNINDSTGYDGEVHVRLQAGTTVSHRAYVNFANFDGVDKWVMGRNADSCWITYNSETIHRIWMDPGASGPNPSFRTGNTYINSAESGKIRFNWHPSDRTGLGGMELWSGGNNGSGVTNNACLVASYPDAEPVGFTGSTATNILTVTSVDPSMPLLAVGQCVVGDTIPNGVYIQSLGSGTGTTGTYNLSAIVGVNASQHFRAFSGQTDFFSTKNAGVGTGAINCFGGAYIARDIRVDGIATLSGAVNVGGILTGTQIIANKALGSDMVKFQESGVTKWSIYAQITGGIAFFNSTLGAAGFAIDASSHVAMAAAYSSKVYTVATLPGSGIIGQRAFVSDANSTTFAAAAVGGGANYVPVYRDNAGWKVG